MRVSRWEKERAAWLLARSKPGTLRRRRAELLAQQGRRLARGGTSAGESALHDDATERLFTRLMKTDEGSVDKLARLVLVPAAYALVWIAVGGAIAIAAALYKGLWTLAPRIGRLWAWPWAAAGALVGIAGGLLLDRGPVVDVSVWPRYFVIDIAWLRFWTMWVWAQLTIGLLFTALQIRRSGWAAVPANAVPRREQNKDGSFRKTPQRQKVRLDPLAGVEIDDHEVEDRPVALTAVPDAPRDEQDPAPFTDMHTAIDIDDDFGFEPDFDDEDGPVFLDEDADDDITTIKEKSA